MELNSSFKTSIEGKISWLSTIKRYFDICASLLFLQAKPFFNPYEESDKPQSVIIVSFVQNWFEEFDWYLCL